MTPVGKVSVLLVEDTAQMREMLRSRLVLDGYEVTTAENGLEAVKVLGRSKPDVVVCDLVMEGLDGYKVVQHVRGDPRLKDVPVIVLTSRGASAEVQKAKALGADDYLVKMSTPPNKLTEKIQAVLKKR